MTDCIDEAEQEQYELRCKYVASIVSKIVSEKIIDAETNPALDLFHMDTFVARMEECQTAFKTYLTNDTTVIHALAVKSNPIRGILARAQQLGFGLECASYPEAIHSLSLNVEPRKIIFDTPCKPSLELKEMMDKGCYINLDNMDEVAKVNTLLAAASHTGAEPQYTKQIGLRINPVVGGGKILSTSTATASSKFGLPLLDTTTEDLYALYANNMWLQGVHIHVGSQGCALEMLVKGIETVMAFITATNTRLGRMQIKVLDIGGGLPTCYDGLSERVRYKDYVDAIHTAVPSLFSSGLTLMTEFGRSMFVKSGLTLSVVETVKTWANQRKAVIHVGANQFLRTAYLPTQWPHVFSVFDATGKPKTSGPFLRHDIAGPMCFSGDYLAKDIWLPEITTGDVLAIHDTGGYTVAMYSKYNSRRASAIYSYEGPSNALSVLKTRETCAETLAFWGLSTPTPL